MSENCLIGIWWNAKWRNSWACQDHPDDVKDADDFNLQSLDEVN